MSHLSIVRNLLLAILVSGAAIPSAHALVRGTYQYRDSDGVRRKIIGVKVEIWRQANGSWGRVDERETDANGSFSLVLPRDFAGKYAVRVYALNKAVQVNDPPTVPFYASPGAPGAEVFMTPRTQDENLDFSWNFDDPGRAKMFNIAEDLRLARLWIDARRAPGQRDVLPRAPVNLVFPTAYLQPYGTIQYTDDYIWNDPTVIHEYVHFVEDKISKMNVQPSCHDGCYTTAGVDNNKDGLCIGEGVDTSSPEQAWMEGFASYLSAVIRASYPAGTFHDAGHWGSFTDDVLERTNICPVSHGAQIEYYVAQSLWDLHDETNEDFDRVSNADDRVLRVFDELSDVAGLPTILTFRDRWAADGFPVEPLNAILVGNHVLVGSQQATSSVGTVPPKQPGTQVVSQPKQPGTQVVQHPAKQPGTKLMLLK